MKGFEQAWRDKVYSNALREENEKLLNRVNEIIEEDPVKYTRALIKGMRETAVEDRIKNLFTECACHMPKEKLLSTKNIYESTGSLNKAHEYFLEEFKKDIKSYKQLSDEDLENIISKGWGAAGVVENNYIIATKIPSLFHEYFKENDPVKKAFYYCHCPRVKKELLDSKDIDSIYCNCGGGFYKNIWETITGKEVKITVLKNLFDGDPVCSFRIKFLEQGYDNVSDK